MIYVGTGLEVYVLRPPSARPYGMLRSMHVGPTGLLIYCWSALSRPDV